MTRKANFDEPHRFRPERVLAGHEMETPAAKRSAFLPFSGGARDCVGRRFAMLESTVLLSVLFRDLSFTPRDGYVLEPVNQGVVQRPREGLFMKAHRA